MCYPLPGGDVLPEVLPEVEPIQAVQQITSMHPEQLRQCIQDVLDTYYGPDLAQPNVVKLLMMVAAHESLGGQYLQQIRGPARGIFQMEPATEWDIFSNFARFRKRMRDIYNEVTDVPPDKVELHQRGNLVRQVVLARMHFLRVPKPIPCYHDDEALGQYAKDYWNTAAGKATPEQYVSAYYKYTAGAKL